MSDIRLVVSDIDCTLIGRDEILPADAPSIVPYLRERGVMFTLASGRVETNALRFVKKMGIDIPYVATNGAVIADCDGNVIMKKKIDALPARAIMEKAYEHHLAVIYTVDGIEYVFDDDVPYIRKYPHRFKRDGICHKITEDEYAHLKLDKVSIMSDSDDDVIAELEKMCAGHEDEYIYTRYQDRSVELVNRTATKASAVTELASMLGIPMENVMFIGDHQNDIELMQAAGIGCAVGNATADAKAAADYVCSNEVFDGVKEAIMKFVGE